MTMRSIKLLAPAVAMIFTASTAPAAVLYSFSTGNKGGSDGYDASFVQT